MSRTVQVGFSQRIQLEWLEWTAELFLAGNTRDQIQIALQDLLRDQLSVGGTAKRGNREKAITILLKIWVSVPKSLKSLRNDGLEHLKRLPIGDHLPVHWGMIMAVYPFLGVVAETIGRLLRLQGSAAAAQVQRRVREQLGERETVSRATRRVLRCFIDWGVLQDTKKEKGVYQPSPARSVKDKKLAAWLIEAALVASGSHSKSLKELAQSPALFPFSINLSNITDLEDSNRLELFRQGLDEDVVVIKNARDMN
ncbi:MAG: hypothetical protein ACE5JP_02750 [Candidatus Bipolaricaulia bacterium]